MRDGLIQNKQTLFFVKFPDKGIYAAGPQEEIPGGPIGYVDREMALEAADAIGGTVEARSLLFAIERCKERQFVLYIRYADGSNGYIAETVPDAPNNSLVRVEGEDREALIGVARRQNVR